MVATGDTSTSTVTGGDTPAMDNGPKSDSTADSNAAADDGAGAVERPAGSRPTSWILEQPGDRYTIQLISTLKNDTLERFIAAHQLNGQTAYFRKRVNGRTWHTLIYGLYPDIAAARAAIADLPEEVRRGKPWVLGIASVQQTINDFNNTP
jgi:septal ring-binding cell division protein DamX